MDEPETVFEDPRLASVYERGNEMPEGSLRAWAALLGSYAPVAAPVLLDLGAGTGTLTAALARATNARRTVALERSPAMVAARRVDLQDVGYVLASAAAIPLQEASVDLVLASRVVHHLADRRVVARELGRVVHPGGVVVIRATLRERLDALVYHYWPQLRGFDVRRFPSLEELEPEFSAGRFSLVDVRSFSQPVYESRRAYHVALSLRPQSKFLSLAAHEFEAGLAALWRDAVAEPSPTPIEERYDVLALQRAAGR